MGRKEDNIKKYLYATNFSTHGELMKIIKYTHHNSVDVEFASGYVSKNKTLKAFLSGKIKNPYLPNVCGVGYIGIDKDFPDEKTDEKIYSCWRNMLFRCYGDKNIGSHGSYVDKVEVCKEWHNYQNFKKWYKRNYYEVIGERMCLDKDVLSKDFLIYSPDTCLFLPEIINTKLIKIKDSKGFTQRETFLGTVYTGQVLIGDKNVYLGKSYNKQDILDTRTKFKKLYLLNFITDYEKHIPNHVYNNIIDFIRNNC